MGLDIYVYRTKDYKKYEEMQNKISEVEKESEKAWDEDPATKDVKYEDMSDKDRDRVRDLGKEASKKKADELGVKYEVSEHGWTEYVNPYYEELGVDSKKHPKHDLFTLGYWRSSYNDSGINHILRNAIGVDLYDFFPEAKNDAYEFMPDWQSAKEKVSKAIVDLKASIEKTGNVQVMKFAYNEFMGLPSEHAIKNEEDALEAYKKEIARERFSDAYSNAIGEFHLEKPLKVKALISGVNKRFFVDEYLPCTFVVYEVSDETANFYIEALEIIEEACDLAINDKEHQYFLHWSG